MSIVEELPLGERIKISGTIVGQSRFANGDVTYNVQYERKGRIVSEWFIADDFDADDFDDRADENDSGAAT